MNTLSAVVLFVAVAAAHAGIISSYGAPIDSAAVLSGPSGTVVRSGVAAAPLAYAAPAVATYAAAPYAASVAAPVAVARTAVAAAPIVSSGIVSASPLAYAAVPAGSGYEGQWIPDINEKFYDDGSFKPWVYGY